MASDPKASQYMSPEDVAQYLGVPIKTLYNWRWRGEGPPFAKLGKHLRALRSDVDAWVASRKAA